MPLLQQWQATAFAQALSQLLCLLPTQCLTHLQFQSICNQMNLVFSSGSEQARLAKYFRHHRTISKQNIFQIIEPIEYKTLHCRPVIVIRMAKTREERMHTFKKCFDFWRSHMHQKYGHQYSWFEKLSGEKKVMRVNRRQMEKRVEEEMKGTPHANCSKRICSVFQKTKTGDLEWSVFMNTLRIRSSQSSASKASKANSECDRSTSKQSRYRNQSPPELKHRHFNGSPVSMFGKSKFFRQDHEEDPQNGRITPFSKTMARLPSPKDAPTPKHYQTNPILYRSQNRRPFSAWFRH